MRKPLKVMFVCAGNICRSPLAHAIFDHEIQARGIADLFETESSGTNGYHVGEMPDVRTRINAAQHGIEVDHISRKFKTQDLKDYDFLFVMDNHNYQDVKARAQTPNEVAKVHLLRDWDPESGHDKEVPDPYMGGEAGFESVYQIVSRTVHSLVDNLLVKYFND